MKRSGQNFGWLLVLLAWGVVACAQEVTVTARVSMTEADIKGAPNPGNVVLWLTPIESQTLPRAADSAPPHLIQKNKTFEPHVLVVPVGSVVQFPNHDPFFHNVFSLFEGKRFDLGLYEAGTTRGVHFDRPGISYIFCNIHPEMSAVIIALDTPYYGLSNARGEVVIPSVPVGRYQMQIWYEGALPDALKAMNREITVSENNSTLGVLKLVTLPIVQSHKNKYGRDYDPPSPDNPAYPHP